jgi:hypothetical protein
VRACTRLTRVACVCALPQVVYLSYCDFMDRQAEARARSALTHGDIRCVSLLCCRAPSDARAHAPAHAQSTAKEQYEREQRSKPFSASPSKARARAAVHTARVRVCPIRQLLTRGLSRTRSQGAPQEDGPGDPLLRDGKQKGFGRKK